MEGHAHRHHGVRAVDGAGPSPNRLALSATIHCLTGCSIGEALGMAIGTGLGLAFASDTASIAIMEIVDNAIMLVILGAMDAGLGDPLFWGSLAVALSVAGVAAFPVVRWLVGRGRWHALVHGRHREC